MTQFRFLPRSFDEIQVRRRVARWRFFKFYLPFRWFSVNFGQIVVHQFSRLSIHSPVVVVLVEVVELLEFEGHLNEIVVVLVDAQSYDFRASTDDSSQPA